jgi:hypothetical protein
MALQLAGSLLRLIVVKAIERLDFDWIAHGWRLRIHAKPEKPKEETKGIE